MDRIERPSELKIDLPLEKIAEFCRKWKIVELSIFGSALRGDFGPDSDLDFLFTLAADAKVTLWDLPAMEDELTTLLGRRAELISRSGIERSRNWIRRREILQAAETIYRAA